MLGNIGKDYVRLTGEPFAKIVAYALGLGAIFWFLGELLGFFNELQTAVRGADVRAALQRLLFTAAFTAAALFVASQYLKRVRLRAVQEVREAGEKALGEVRAQWGEVLDLLEIVAERSPDVGEHLEKARATLRESDN